MAAVSNRALALQAEKSVLYFAPLPTSSSQINIIKSQPVTDYLSKTLQRRVIPKVYHSYDDLISAFTAAEIQLLEIGPLPFIALQKLTTHATPLVSINLENSTPHYRCVLASPADGLQDLSQIINPSNSKVALTQPLSTCGPLFTRQLLMKNQYDLDSMPHQFLGSHEAVALALIRNEYKLGGLAKFIAERYQKLGLTILATSQSIPSFMIVGNNQSLSKSELEKIKQALLSYPSGQNEGIGKHGFSAVNLTNMEAFRQFVIKLDPSFQEKK